MPYAATGGKAFHSKGAGEFAHDSLRLGVAAHCAAGRSRG